MTTAPSILLALTFMNPTIPFAHTAETVTAAAEARMESVSGKDLDVICAEGVSKWHCVASDPDRNGVWKTQCPQLKDLSCEYPYFVERGHNGVL